MTRHSIFAAVALALCLGHVGVSKAEGVSVVAIGNSITHHGPAPAINWTGNWGMAASSEANDYLGQLTRLIKERAARQAHVQRFSLTALEANPKEARLDPAMLASTRASGLLVVELGDNVRPENTADFGTAYANLVLESRPTHGLMVCLSTWWNTPTLDALIKPACERAGGVFVYIGDIRLKPGRTGSREQGLTDPGVLSHPGDAGMADIASRAFEAWRGHQKRTP